MGIFEDCLRTAEGRQAIEIGNRLREELGQLTRETSGPLYAVLYQLLIERSLKDDLFNAEKQKSLREAWWQAQGYLSKRSVSRYLDERVGND